MFEDGRTVRVGLIGYGYAGKTFHAPLIQSVAGLELIIVGSSKRDTVMADLPGVTVCSNMEEAATHPEVDLLVLASPNEVAHVLTLDMTGRTPQTQALLNDIAKKLQKGGGTFERRSLDGGMSSVELADARSLVQLAEERGQLLSVFHNRRWDSEVLAAKAIVESGMLGEISHFETHIDRFRPQVRQRWREQTGPGAGLWFDLGPHLIDQAVQLFGVPETINASFAVLRKGGETDDWAHVQLNYPSLRVILHTSLIASGGGPRSVLHGTLGSWAKFGADVQEKQLAAGVRPGSPGFGEDPDPGILYEGATGQQTKIPAPAANQAEYYVGIREALWGRQPNPVPPEQASAVMSMLDTSFQSGATGRVLPLQLTYKERAAFAVSPY